MEEKKYEILMDEENSNTVGYNTTVHRIKALKNIENSMVKKGDIGGYVESESNLSQEGDCWIHDDAVCYGNAKILENAVITNDVSVFDNAVISGDAFIRDDCCIFNNAVVKDKAQLNDHCKVHGNASVYGEACVYGLWIIKDNAEVFGDVGLAGDTNTICDDAKVYDSVFITTSNAKICGDTCILGDISLYLPSATLIQNGIIENRHDYLFIGSLGSNDSVCSFYRSHGIPHNLGASIDNEYAGSIDDIDEYSRDNHTWYEYEEEFKIAFDFARKYFNIKDTK